MKFKIPAQLLQELLGQSILQAYWHCFWALLPEPEAHRKLNTGLQTGSYESRISKNKYKVWQMPDLERLFIISGSNVLNKQCKYPQLFQQLEIVAKGFIRFKLQQDIRGAGAGQEGNNETHRPTLVFNLLPPINPSNFGVKLIQRVHCQQNLLAFHFCNAVKLTPGHKCGFLHHVHQFQVWKS